MKYFWVRELRRRRKKQQVTKAQQSSKSTHMCVYPTPHTQFLTPVGISLIFIYHTQTRTQDHMYGWLGTYDRVRSPTAPTLALKQHEHTYARIISNTFNCSPNYSRYPPPLYCLSLSTATTTKLFFTSRETKSNCAECREKKKSNERKDKQTNVSKHWHQHKKYT